MRDATGAQRTADTLLRVMGGGPVLLRMTTQAALGDAGQVGIQGTLYQDLTLQPAVLRRLVPKLTAGEPQEYEMLISASAVDSLVQATDSGGAQQLFASAAGIVLNGSVKAVTGISAAEAFGQPYLYTVLLRDC